MINPFRTPQPPQKRTIDPDRFKALVAKTDAHFDAQLYEGQPMDEVFRIEAERDAAHAMIRKAAFELSVGEYRRQR